MKQKASLFSQSVLNGAAGELKTYSDGCRIFDKNHQVANGGDSINYIHEGFWPFCPDLGYSTFQGTLILPWPNEETRAMLFHIRIKRDFLGVDILTSDIRFQNGQTVVENRNMLKMELDNAFPGYISAVKHGNGRDWWIVIPSTRRGIAVVGRFSENGIQPFTAQDIILQTLDGSSARQTSFSPDGNKYVLSGPSIGVLLLPKCGSESFSGISDSLCPGGCALS